METALSAAVGTGAGEGGQEGSGSLGMVAGGGGQVGGRQVASGRGKAEDGGVAGHRGSDRPGLCLSVEVGALKVLTKHKGEWLQECFSPSSGYLFEGPGRPPSRGKAESREGDVPACLRFSVYGVDTSHPGAHTWGAVCPEGHRVSLGR